jgi:hypothetical protein
MRTREGKGWHLDFVPFGVLRPLGSAPLSADHGSLVLVGTFLRECFRRPDNGNARVAVTSTTSNESDRDSLPDKIENSLPRFLAELSEP